MDEPDTHSVEQGTARGRKLLWGGLPDFCAVVPVVWCLSYAITGLHVAGEVGRQSSTAGLGPGLAILAAPFLAALGLLSGRLARYLLRGRIRAQWLRPLRWGGVLALVVVGVLASRQASVPIRATERAAQPRVLLNTAQIEKRTAGLAMESLQRATRVYSYPDKVDRPIQWEERSVRFADTGDALELQFTPGGTSLRIPLAGIDYVNAVDAIPLRMGAAGRQALALLVTGRATGRRDLIAVVSPGGELLYLELLERSWNFRQVPLATAATAAGEVILVGTEPQHMLAFDWPG